MGGTADDGCKTQFEQASLGPSTSWTFLAKEGSTTVRKLRQGDGLSTANVLRFKPVAFETGGSYKGCFCDSSLPPADVLQHVPRRARLQRGHRLPGGRHHADVWCPADDPGVAVRVILGLRMRAPFCWQAPLFHIARRD